MKMTQHLLAVTLAACSCSVFAQWQWVDETGRKVFSDRPPPAHIAPQQILKSPPGHAVAPATGVLYPTADGSAPAAPEPAPVAARASAEPAAEAAPEADDAQAAREKAQEEALRKAEEAERKKLEAQQAKARQENCQRARTAQASLQSGGLISHVNEKGERGLMTEPQRQAELQRVQKLIRDNCK